MARQMHSHAEPKPAVAAAPEAAASSAASGTEDEVSLRLDDTRLASRNARRAAKPF